MNMYLQRICKMCRERLGMNKPRPLTLHARVLARDSPHCQDLQSARLAEAIRLLELAVKDVC
jgi:hypothetical protein